MPRLFRMFINISDDCFAELAIANLCDSSCVVPYPLTTWGAMDYILFALLPVRSKTVPDILAFVILLPVDWSISFCPKDKVP